MVPQSLAAAINHNPIVVAPKTSVKPAIAHWLSGANAASENGRAVANGSSPGVAGFGAVVVAESGVVGIVTQRSLLPLLLSPTDLEDCLVETVMVPPPQIVRLTALPTIASLLESSQTHADWLVPVVDDHNQLVGTLTRASLLAIWASQPTETMPLDQPDEECSMETFLASPAPLAPQPVLPDLIFRVNRAGDYLEFITVPDGISLNQPDTCVGHHFSTLVPSEFASQRMTHLATALDTGTTVTYEQTIDIHGKSRCQEIRIAPCNQNEALVIVRDVSDRQHPETIRPVGEQQYADLLTVAPVGIFRADVSGNCIFTNAGWSKITGLTDTDALGDAWQQAVHPDDRDWLVAEWRQVVEQQRSTTVEYRLQQTDDSIRWIYVQVEPEFSCDGACIGFVGAVTDITDRKRADLIIREREQQYANLVSVSPVGIFRTDERGYCTFASDKWCEIAGYPLTEVLGPGWEKALHPEDHDRVIAEWYQAVAENRLFQAECRFLKPTGQVTWIVCQAVAERGLDGQVQGYVGTITDISDRHVSEQALQASEHRFQLIANTIDAVFWIDDIKTNRPIYTSPNFEAVWGLPVDQIEDGFDCLLARIHPDDRDRVAKYLIDEQYTFTSDETIVIEFRIQTDTGEIRWLTERFYPIMNDEGEAVQLIGLTQDVTATKQATIALTIKEAENQAILAAIPDLVVRANRDGTYLANYGNYQDFDVVPEDEEIRGRSIVDYLPQAVAERQLLAIQQALDTGEPQTFEQRLCVDDSCHYEEFKAVKLTDDEALYVVRNISDRKRAEIRLAQQNQLLERIAANEPLADIFTAIILTAEADLKGGLGSILQLDGQNRLVHGAAPHLPAGYLQAVDGVTIGEGVGTCGTAAYRQATVCSVDIARDPLWQNFKAIALEHDLQACWSVPVISSQGAVLGTFGIYYNTPKNPTDEELEAISQLAKVTAIAIERDRTAKALRASEARWQFALEGTQQGVWDWHVPTGEVFYSQQWKGMLGYEAAEIGNTFDEWESRVHPHDLAQCYVELEQHIAGKIPVYLQEHRVRRKDNTYAWILTRGKVVEWTADRQPQRILGIHTDITARKQAELQLRQQDAQHRAILSAIPDLMFRVNADGIYRGFVKLDEAFALVTSEDAILNRSLEEVLPSDVAKRQRRALQRALATGNMQTYEQRLKVDDRWQDEEVRVIQCGDDEALFMIREITDRKQAERDLRLAEARLRKAQALANIGNWEVDHHRHVVFWSEQVYHILELPTDQVVSCELFLSRAHPDDRDTVHQTYLHHLDSKTPYDLIYRLQMADGRIKHIHEHCETDFTTDGRPLISRGSIQDITRLQEAELEKGRLHNALQHVVQGTAALTGEQFFAAFARHIAEALQIHHVAICRVTDHGFENMIFWSEGELHPSARSFSFDAVLPCTQALEMGEYLHLNDLHLAYPNYDLIAGKHVESYIGLGLHDTAGKAIGVLAILHDRPIPHVEGTHLLLKIFAARAGAELERQQHYESLQHLNAELESRVEARSRQLADQKAQLADFLDHANDLIHSHSLPEGRFAYVNRAWERTLGYPADEAQALTIYDVLHPGCRDRYEQLCEQMAAGQRSAIDQFELVLLTRSGQPINIECNINCQIVNGQPVSIRSIGRDITERKRTAAERDRLLTLLESSNNEIYIFNAHSLKFVFANHGAVQNLQYNLETIKQKTPVDLKPNFTEASFRSLIAPLLAGEVANLLFEAQHRRADGSFYPVEINLQAHSYLGETFCLAVVSDISERLATQQENQRLRERLEFLLSESPAVIFTCHPDSDYGATFIGENIRNLVGYTDTEFLAQSSLWRDNLHPDDVPPVLARLEQAHVNHEYRFRHKAGHYVWLRAELQQIHDADGNLIEYIGYLADITEIKQAEEDLRDRERLLELFFTQSQDGFFFMMLDTPICWDSTVDKNAILEHAFHHQRITKVNQAFLNQYGAANTDFIGQTPADLYSEAPLTGKLLWRQLYDNGRLHLNAQEQKLDGTSIWVEGDYICLYDQAGRITGHFGIQRDMSGFYEVVANLEASEAKYQRLVDDIGDKFVVFSYSSSDRQITYLSSGVNTVFGLPREHILGNSWLETICWLPHSAALLEVYDQRLQQGVDDSQQFEAEFRHPDGGQRVILIVQHPVFDETEQLIAIEGVVEDVTEQKQAERELKRSQRFITSVAQASPNILYLFDLALRRNIYTNRDIAIVLGYAPTELEGIGDRFLISKMHPDDLHRYRQHYRQFAHLADGEIIECEYRLQHADGSWRWLISRDAVFKRNANGEVQQIIGTAQDISDRKLAESQLYRTNQELERATRLKDEFLASMSHELRTPLNAILGMTESLKEQIFGTVSDRQQKALNTIENSGTHLLELINDILDVAKIEAGQLEIEPSPVPVDTLCSSSLLFIKHQALQKSIHLSSTIPQQIPDLLVDERRVRQILINLLSNAVKFTPERGQIVLQVQRNPNYATDHHAHYLDISISDTGIGIARKNLDKLFQPFVQIDSALNRQYAGTGLGLALVKRIAELHGGQVTVQSEEGIGSCFTVTLPCAEKQFPVCRDIHSQHTVSIAAECSTAASPLLLLAEDNEANVLTLSSYLEAKGYRLQVARTGHEVISMVDNGESPDLILMDIQMPGIDGITATQHIRQVLQKDIPIIAQTALAMEGDRDRCLAAGADEYITKPIKFRELSNLIADLLQKNQ
ncbi:MAG: PAS domain S-box protein [Leptolyngbyaceae cyanobacterium]